MGFSYMADRLCGEAGKVAMKRASDLCKVTPDCR